MGTTQHTNDSESSLLDAHSVHANMETPRDGIKPYLRLVLNVLNQGISTQQMETHAIYVPFISTTCRGPKPRARYMR